MLFEFIALLLALLAFGFFYLKNKHKYWERRGVIFDPPVFPHGSFKGIGQTLHFRDIYGRVYRRFKGTAPFVGMYFMFKPGALILDLDLVKRILIKDFSNFRDRNMFHNARDDPLTGNLFFIDGEQWRALRAKLTPVFTSGKMKFMFSTIVAVSENLIDTCETLVAADKDGALDLKELCIRYTTDVIGTCAFGLECNSLKDPNAEFRLKGRSIMETQRHPPLVQLFMITFTDLARKLRMKIFTDELIDFFVNVVRDTVEFRLKNNIKRNDFMDLLIELKATDEAAARKADVIDFSQGLTLEQMAGQAFVFFLAGFDTSANIMSFCLYELALNQEIQHRLRNEIIEVLQQHNGQLTYEAMNEMKYLDQVLSETLRKYSVIPNMQRTVEADYKVPNTDYVLEAGTLIFIPNDAIQHDPEYFPEPEKFDPSRFEPEEVKKRHDMAYLPFGDGPRNCIGVRFGKMQAKVGLINLLRHYKFTKSSRTEENIEFDIKSFVIAAKSGIHLHIERI